MDEEKQYALAFNDGYLLAKYQPDLFKKIQGSLVKDSPLLHGKQEYEIEKGREHFKKFDRGESKEKTKDKNKDKDKGIRP